MRSHAFPPDWLIPDWPAPPGVRALCTTRHGGFSVAPYDRMNLGDHVGDVPARVAANRALLSQSAGAAPVFLRQVHGTSVLTLDGSTADGRQADAAITTQRGVACTIMVADCLPVLLTNVDGTAVAAAHAGWRGLAGRQGRGVGGPIRVRSPRPRPAQCAPEARGLTSGVPGPWAELAVRDGPSPQRSRGGPPSRRQCVAAGPTAPVCCGA